VTCARGDVVHRGPQPHAAARGAGRDPQSRAVTESADRGVDRLRGRETTSSRWAATGGSSPSRLAWFTGWASPACCASGCRTCRASSYPSCLQPRRGAGPGASCSSRFPCSFWIRRRPTRRRSRGRQACAGPVARCQSCYWVVLAHQPRLPAESHAVLESAPRSRDRYINS